MRFQRQIFILIAFFCLLSSSSQAQIPTADAVPEDVYTADKFMLSQQRADLMNELSSLNGLIASHDSKCSQVADTDQGLIASCSSEMQDLKAKVTEYQTELAAFKKLSNERVVFKTAFNSHIKTLGLSKEKQDHLNTVLNSLAIDGDMESANSEIIQSWQDILARRGKDADLAKEASSEGPNFPGAGTQSSQDCALFALANAANLPYGVVAARATKLISDGTWHNDTERTKPQEAIEKHGLNGYEVAILAETFGTAEVVPMSDFSKTLKEGRPIILDVVPQGGLKQGGHEVVLTKSFTHNGETWYEMMDSNQGPQERLYLSHKELSTILQEKGIAFQPEAGTTVKSLK